jgi:hypothetical protein
MFLNSCDKKNKSNSIIGSWTRQLHVGIIDTMEVLPNGKYNQKLTLNASYRNGTDSVTDISKRVHTGFWKLKQDTIIEYSYSTYQTISGQKIKLVKDLKTKEDTNNSNLDSTFAKYLIDGDTLILTSKFNNNGRISIETNKWKKVKSIY